MDYDILKTPFRIIQQWDLILKTCFDLSGFLRNYSAETNAVIYIGSLSALVAKQ